MLTGRAFRNEEAVADTLIGVLTREPDWAALPPQTPQKIRALLERCLRKDPRRRRADMGHARIEIEEVQNNRDKMLVEALRQSQESHQQLAAGLSQKNNTKKWWEFWKS